VPMKYEGGILLMIQFMLLLIGWNFITRNFTP